MLNLLRRAPALLLAAYVALGVGLAPAHARMLYDSNGTGKLQIPGLFHIAPPALNNLFQVTNRTHVPNELPDASLKYVLAQTQHQLFCDVANDNLEIWWPNWRATVGRGTQLGGAAEVLPGAAATGSANLTYIDRATKQNVTVNLVDKLTGSTALTAPDGGYFKARATVNALAGTIVPKIAANFPNGMMYAQNQADIANGDLFQYGTSPIPLSNTPTNTYAGNLGLYAPILILAPCGATMQAVGIIGNSRNSALADVPNDAYGNSGQGARLIGRYRPYVNVSVPGDTAADFAVPSQSQRRREVLGYAAYPKIYLGDGVNDIVFQGATAANTKAANDNTASSLGKTPIYATIDPVTKPGDPTTVNNPTPEPQRKAYNTIVRAQTYFYDPASVLETGGASSPAGTYARGATDISADGVHELNTGNQYAADNANFPLATIGSPPLFNVGFQYPAGAAYQSLALADGWQTQNASLSTNAIYSPAHKVTGAILTEDTTASTGHTAFFQPALTLAGKTVTYGIFAKRVTGARNIQFSVQQNGGSYGQTRIWVNLGTCVATTVEQNAGTLGSVTAGTFDDYCKVSMPITYPAGFSANPFVFVKMADSAGNDNVSGAGNSVALWGVDIR